MKGAEMLSTGQGEAMQLISESQRNVLVRLRCGEGKTMSYVVPLSLAKKGMIVFTVVPYRSLVQTMLTKLTDMNIRVSEFDFSERFLPSSFHNGVRSQFNPVEFVIATSDKAADERGVAFCQAAYFAGRLQSIVFDEVHQICLSRTFRSCMKDLAIYRTFNVQMIFLSGTCPDVFWKEICSTFCIDSKLARVISPGKDKPPTKRAISTVFLSDAHQNVLEEYAVKAIDERLTKKGEDHRPKTHMPFDGKTQGKEHVFDH